MYPTTSDEAVVDFEMPLAPLAEQRRIVAKLETLLGKVDVCQRRLAKIPRLLKRFRQSVLAAACSGRLTADWREGRTTDCTDDTDKKTSVKSVKSVVQNPVRNDAVALVEKMQEERRRLWSERNGKRIYREPESIIEEDLPQLPDSWCWTNFDHCAWEITVGHVGPMKDRYTPTGITFLRSQNVRPLRFSEVGLVRIPPAFHSSLSKSELFGGEILVVRSGANTGDCCVFPRGMGKANCADLVITRPLSGLCAEYGAHYVCSPTGQARLNSNETGIAQPHFNIGAMKTKAFPLPPLLEQREIVRRVEQLFTFADQLEARFAKAQAHVDKLTPSLLAKAFRGELVPQDPNDEPASALLARLRGKGASAKPRRTAANR